MYDDNDLQDRGYAARGLARVLFIIFAAPVYFLVHVARRLGRWHNLGRAESWPAADATVTSSYELDENQVAFSSNGWDSAGEEDDYTPSWAVVLEYSYQAEGESYSGSYFLPYTYCDGETASEAERAWADKKIIVRYNPSRPKQSFFLEQDGAPGKPHIPRLLSWKPYITDLSLR